MHLELCHVSATPRCCRSEAQYVSGLQAEIQLNVAHTKATQSPTLSEPAISTSDLVSALTQHRCVRKLRFGQRSVSTTLPLGYSMAPYGRKAVCIRGHILSYLQIFPAKVHGNQPHGKCLPVREAKCCLYGPISSQQALQ